MMDVIERLEKGISKLTVTKLSSDIPAYVRGREQEIELVRLAKLGKQMQWVSVADRLPEVGQLVIAYGEACLIKPFVTAAILTNWGAFLDVNESTGFIPTHWMPLPEPPKGEE